jgi:membrane protein
VHDKLFREASALTYQSFLALVPILAVLFGIAKGFGLDHALEKWIRIELKDHQEILSYFLQFSQTTLKEASGGIIAGFGVFFLLFTTVRLLSAVETTLTSMWGLQKGRPFVRKVSDYLALLLICPILLAMSGSATIFATTELTSLTGTFDTVKPIFTLVIGLFPFLTSAALFSLILFAMPCAPVRFRSALIAGAIASVIFQVTQAWYIIFQLKLTKVSAVYGSFVALPLFLVWLWISWLLVLIAGEICVFIQERGWRPSCLHFTNSPKERFEADLSVLALSQSQFHAEKLIDTKSVYKEIPLPIKALSHSVERLENQGLIHIRAAASFSSTLIPSKRTNTLTLADLVLPEGKNAPETPLTRNIDKILTTWKTELKNDTRNFTLVDLPLLRD